MIQLLELQPVDTLFFRDARPMRAGAGSGGHGANWPMPTVVHEALRAALLRISGLMPDGNRPGINHRKAGRKGFYITSAFDSLRTLGPLPVRAGMLSFPTPCDAVPDEEQGISVRAPIQSPPGESNLPAPWLTAVASKSRPSKAARWRWVSQDFLCRYLAADPRLSAPTQEVLFCSEHRIGIGLDRTTWSAAEGKLFTSEHLRLVDGVRLAVAASLSPRDAALEKANLSLSDCFNLSITLGGESRMCRIIPAEKPWLEGIPRPTGTRVKWVLATPAVFRGGWLPNWVAEQNGSVLLRLGETDRLPDEDRKTWRERVRDLPPIRARLIAACMDKPVAFSGWDLNLESGDKGSASARGGPKPTMLAVPAGSVYYFEAQSAADAAALVNALHGRTRSDFFGEKGMGWGFCGSWQPLKV